ncbi:hypothetical protein ASE68_10610 [Agromyces sp. Leaf222]|nr:hypothetical protein ASE68_10610 [Agromyces sp. Leaf222]
MIGPMPEEYASTEADRIDAADWLHEVVSATRNVQEAMQITLPAGIVTLDTSRDVNDAARLVSLHMAIAIDHLVSFAGLLRVPGSHGPSLATINRTVVETWARAWWVMGAMTSIRAEYRARAMVVRELHAAKDRGILLLSGESIDVAISRATRDRDRIHVRTPETVPRPTALAIEMLQAAVSPGPEAAAIYSHLSGVAHGESVYTASLTEQPIAYPVPQVVLPADNLKKYLTQLFGVTMIGTVKLTSVWGLPETIGDEYLQSMTEIGNRLPAHLGGSAE